MLEDNIEFYVNYYVIAAEAGVLSAEYLDRADVTAQLADPEEYDIKQAATKNKQTFVDGLRWGEQTINSFSTTIRYMQSSFIGLSKYIEEVENKDFNTYLADNNITVSNTYANISKLCGIEIDSTNIL